MLRAEREVDVGVVILFRSIRPAVPVLRKRLICSYAFHHFIAAVGDLVKEAAVRRDLLVAVANSVDYHRIAGGMQVLCDAVVLQHHQSAWGG